MANVQVIISALNRASSEIAKVKKILIGVGKSGKDAQGGLKTFGDGLSSAWKLVYPLRQLLRLLVWQ